MQLPDSASVAADAAGHGRIEIDRPRDTGRGAHGGHLRAVADPECQRGEPGSMYVMLKEFAARSGPDLTADAIAAKLRDRCGREVLDAVVTAFGPPPIEGLGTTGGFRIIVEDRGNLGLGELQRSSDRIVDRGNRTPGLEGLFTSIRANTPWLYLDIDRTKCMALGVPVSEVFNTLQVYLGSYYVNNFNEFGRTWQVNVQADQSFRERGRDHQAASGAKQPGADDPAGDVARRPQTRAVR